MRVASRTRPRWRGPEFTALVFSKTAGYRHASIVEGVAAIQRLGSTHGFHVHATEDARVFAAENLRWFDVVVWLSTSGEVLDGDQRDAFESYIARGGGYAGVHAAADTELGWGWYEGLVGAYFTSHPHQQAAILTIEDSTHLSTTDLPHRWRRFDEWYNYRTNPRSRVHVLASLDENSYDPGANAMGDHPIAWCHDYRGGRAWYTGMGHTAESYSDPFFLAHLLGGMRSAAGVATVTHSDARVTAKDLAPQRQRGTALVPQRGENEEGPCPNDTRQH